MLSSLGVIWSFGFNGYGQLGQGHLDSNYDCTEPREISKFIGDSTSFVTDVCAESKGSSFAIDDKGKLYRWGYNQV
jgi:alpha-tubulin suppressor-like RCC1 family protein